MARKNIASICAALALMAVGSNASANFISMSPSGQTTGVGGQVTVDIHMEFFDNTVGGAFDLFYDSALLTFVSFEFNPNFLGSVADPDFAVMPDDCFSDGAALGGCNVGDGELNGIGFGSFDGISGDHLVGTVTFEALQIGLAILTMATNDTPWEGFVSADDASDLVVLYAPAKVRVVPLPAGLWLLGSAVMLIVGAARRRR